MTLSINPSGLFSAAVFYIFPRRLVSVSHPVGCVPLVNFLETDERRIGVGHVGKHYAQEEYGKRTASK